MNFTEPVFFLFFAVLFAGFWATQGNRAKTWLLLAGSLFFYSWNYPPHFFLLLFFSLLSYKTGELIQRNPGSGSKYLAGYIVASISTLFFFKYFNKTLLPTFNQAFSQSLALQLVQPIGISFFLFQSISYVFDINRHKVRPTNSFREYFLYISFFPQIVAGPIVKARDFLYQIPRKRRLNWKTFQTGIWFVILGYFHKSVIADNIHSILQTHWELGYYIENGSLLPLVLAFLFGIEIYADFIGYSTIAIGLAYLFGFKLPTNFNFPYIARSFSEFWTRWHITLSTWLKEYLYFPLGGNRGSKRRTYLNLLLVMIIGGLWHGGTLNYGAWGLLHGIFLVSERWLRNNTGLYGSKAFRGFWACVTIAGVFFAWIFFRTENMKHSLLFARSIFQGGWNWEAVHAIRHPLLFALGLSSIVVGTHFYNLLKESGKCTGLTIGKPILAGIMLACILVFYGMGADFIYFQF